MVDEKQKYKYLQDMLKCKDGRMRRAFRIPGNGQTIFVMCNGVPTKSKEIKIQGGGVKSDPKSVICFTAGPKSNSQYTNKEFLALGKNGGLGCYADCPTNLKGWLKYTGAIKRSSAGCVEIVAKNKQMTKNNNKVYAAEDALDKCMENSVCSRKHTAWKEMGASCEFPTHRVSAKCAAITCPSEVGKLGKAHKKWSKVSGSQTWYSEQTSQPTSHKK